MSTSNSSSGGVGIFGLLGVAFIVLKLCRVIDWNWWWVLAPFWGVFAIWAVGFAVIVLVAIAKALRRR